MVIASGLRVRNSLHFKSDIFTTCACAAGAATSVAETARAANRRFMVILWEVVGWATRV
jgi:hypothetical protein